MAQIFFYSDFCLQWHIIKRKLEIERMAHLISLFILVFSAVFFQALCILFLHSDNRNLLISARSFFVLSVLYIFFSSSCFTSDWFAQYWLFFFSLWFSAAITAKEMELFDNRTNKQKDEASEEQKNHLNKFFSETEWDRTFSHNTHELTTRITRINKLANDNLKKFFVLLSLSSELTQWQHAHTHFLATNKAYGFSYFWNFPSTVSFFFIRVVCFINAFQTKRISSFSAVAFLATNKMSYVI